MKAAVNFVMFLISAMFMEVAPECPMARFYSELGCQPAPSTGAGACPPYYTCPDRSDPTKCYYKGTAINSKESIPAADIKNPCLRDCRCDLSSEPSFNCARVDCFKDRDYTAEQESSCIRTYSLDECCSVGKVCGKDALAKLTTCTMDGEVYMEGEKFVPDPRRTCICTAEWNGTLTDTYCREDIECKLDLQYQSQISRNCGPMFMKDSACPTYFVCLTAASQVVKSSNSSGVSAQCQFEGLVLNVGDEVPVVSQGCTKCVCEVPPFVSCRSANDYGCGRKDV